VYVQAYRGFESHSLRQNIVPDRGPALLVNPGLLARYDLMSILTDLAEASGTRGGLKVAVNLSPVQFASPTLVQDVAAALAMSGLPAHRLELEITETAMLEDTDTVLAIPQELNGLGAKIALDDFGTGYSSLSYLRRFPFSKVKIDRSFISGLGMVEGCDIIVAAIIGLCERLGIITTSEGVETQAQLSQLAALNCTEAQGYLFSRPRPIDDVAELCRTLTRPAKQPVVLLRSQTPILARVN
jgi:EAL domain-containing protein (putative c-di-GMP-specific phosphodiesterase class I)